MSLVLLKCPVLNLRQHKILILVYCFLPLSALFCPRKLQKHRTYTKQIMCNKTLPGLTVPQISLQPWTQFYLKWASALHSGESSFIKSFTLSREHAGSVGHFCPGTKHVTDEKDTRRAKGLQKAGSWRPTDVKVVKRRDCSLKSGVGKMYILGSLREPFCVLTLYFCVHTSQR